MVAPKFLICQNNDSDDIYVLHTEYPRFLVLVVENDDGTISMTSDNMIKIDEWKPGTDVMEPARLMRQMGDWYYEQINS
jgi:hypothetical protein